MIGGTCGDNRFGGFPFGWFGALSTLGRPLQLSPSNLLTDVLLILAFGSFTGAMIITGGALINSDYGFSNQSPHGGAMNLAR